MPTGIVALMPTRYWVETLGCPKNQVDSDKLVGTLVADGMRPASISPSVRSDG